MAGTTWRTRIGASMLGLLVALPCALAAAASNHRAGGIGSEWLALGGARHRYHLDAGACAKRGPCLVEARHGEQPTSAVPADRYLAVKGNGAVDLWLPDGSYVITYRNAGGVVRADRVAARQGTTVPLGADRKQTRQAAALSGRKGGTPQ